MADPLPIMRGFPVPVRHVPASAFPEANGRFAVGLEGTGDDRRLHLLVRHADGSGLAFSLSDLGMGRFGDIITDAYASEPVATVQARLP